MLADIQYSSAKITLKGLEQGCWLELYEEPKSYNNKPLDFGCSIILVLVGFLTKANLFAKF